MIIRQMTAKELPIAVSLYVDANLFAKKKDIYAWTKKGLKNFPQLNLVCENRKKIIGAISAIATKRFQAVINDIVVAKEYRNHGIGRKLMLALFKILKAEKVKHIDLWIHWKNARAIPFYYQFGFQLKKVEVTKDITGVPDGEDIIHLTKIL